MLEMGIDGDWGIVRTVNGEVNINPMIGIRRIFVDSNAAVKPPRMRQIDQQRFPIEFALRAKSAQVYHGFVNGAASNRPLPRFGCTKQLILKGGDEMRA